LIRQQIAEQLYQNDKAQRVRVVPGYPVMSAQTTIADAYAVAR
jgi:hypothetical protein